MGHSSLPIGLWRARAIAQRGWFSFCDKVFGPLIDHRRLEQRVRDRDGPIRIGFLVCSPSKWSAQALFETLQSDRDFEPFFIVTLSDVALRSTRDERRTEHEGTEAFFSAIGPVASSLYDKTRDRMRIGVEPNSDLIFVQQPWGMQSLPRQLNGTHLTAYIHYGFPVIQNDQMQFGLPHFHPYLWCHYLPSEGHAVEMKSKPVNKSHRVFVAGHPKLDVFLTPRIERGAVLAWPNAVAADRKRIIFAPHHTLLSKGLALGTFEWSGPVMADFARDHSDVDFLFRPHPNFKAEIDRAGPEMGQIYQRFERDWNEMDHCDTFETEGYFDVFRTSDLMVTDCGSFLAEYLPTGNPLIRLMNEGAAPLNAAGQDIVKGFHQAHGPSQLRSFLDAIIVDGFDELKSVRLSCAEKLMPDQKASLNILNHLRQSFVVPRGSGTS